MSGDTDHEAESQLLDDHLAHVARNGAVGASRTDAELRYSRVYRPLVDGVPEAEMLGKRDDDIYPAEVASRLREPKEAARDSGEVVEREMTLPDGDDDRTYRQVVAPIRGRDGTVEGVMDVAYDVTAQVDLEATERKLSRRCAQLEHVERVGDCVRGALDVLLGASTREEVYQPLCDRLASADLYEDVWIADYHSERDEVVLRARSGDAVADGGTVAVGIGDADDGALRRAVDTLEPQVVTADAPHPPVARSAAVDAAERRAVVVPLTYGRIVYGVVGLATDRSDAFDEYERRILRELGTVTGYAYHTIENERQLLSDTVVELTFRSTDRRSFLIDLSATHGYRGELQSLVPASDGTLLVYETISGVDPQVVVDAALDEPTVSECRVIRERDDEALLQFQLVESFVTLTLAEYGANVRSIVVEGGVADFVCEVSPETDVRALVEQLRTSFPETELVRKREVDRSTRREPPGDEPEPIERLTARQRDALEAAYRAGYFEWSRESTAEEVAAAMGITAPTFHKHLRKGLNAVMVALFDEDRRYPSG
ncbi:bacterio-opsin activator domain-containing protein [Halomarina pelagica]|uniref:bacterio-opsin activator domain-containing protein n=1 Tax=Halomarina pelagica TaxID=2961599 RepID=UPI0020C2EF92|nr:bacterio-opsin activator domain-containing protein [Halomarina sp. BND7]